MKLVSKEFTFDAAHLLTNYKGKCSRLHGHTYKLIITVKEVEKGKDMIIDFVQLKALVKSTVIDIYDHQFLNDLEDYKDIRTTAENMVEKIWARLIPFIPNLYEVILYETPTSYITYRG